MWFPDRTDTNRTVQAQKMVRGWKFSRKRTIRIAKNKGADQLRSYCEPDLRLCFSHRQNVGCLMTRLIYYIYMLLKLVCEHVQIYVI